MLKPRPALTHPSPQLPMREPSLLNIQRGQDLGTLGTSHLSPRLQGEKLYLWSRNMNSVISPTDLFPGSLAERRVSGSLHLGKSEERRRSRVWKVSRGSWDCEERMGPKAGGKKDWAASPGLSNARHSASAFRVHLV